MKRSGYSVHAIQPNGQPAPVGHRPSLKAAVNYAEETAKRTGLEVRVWDARAARCKHVVPAAEYEATHAA